MDWIKAAFAAVGAVAAYIWGPFDALIIALICVVVIDYITGVLNAALKHELSSGIGFKGLLKKIFIFALVAVAAIADRIVPAANKAIRAAVIMFYIANESISILENAAKLGLPLPVKLKGLLEGMKK